MSVEASQYLVCSTPNIWVFDDLLSDSTVGAINDFCDSTDVPIIRSSRDRNKISKRWPLQRDSNTEELFSALLSVASIWTDSEIQSVVVRDVWSGTQQAHVDHISYEDVTRCYKQSDFLDLSKQSNSNGQIVPTLSIVIYLNGTGGIHFPHAAVPEGKTVQGRPGRIIMFQNYLDSLRPQHNPLAVHYGTYFQDTPKRLITIGVLANQTPQIFETGVCPQGLIYCPDSTKEGIEHFSEAMPNEEIHAIFELDRQLEKAFPEINARIQGRDEDEEEDGDEDQEKEYDDMLARPLFKKLTRTQTGLDRATNSVFAKVASIGNKDIKVHWVVFLTLLVLEVISSWYFVSAINAHYIFDGWTASWSPVSKCKLPPPQPFYLDATLSIIKTCVVAYAFGSVIIWNAHQKAEIHSWILTWGLGLYQITLVPLSLGLAIHAFFDKQGPFDDFFSAYQCAGAMAMTGPWPLSLMTAVLQFVVTERLQQHSLAWFDGFQDEDLWKKGKGGVTDLKKKLVTILVLSLVILFGPLMIFFFGSHIGLGFIAFSPVMLPIGGLGCGLTRSFGGFERLQRLLKKGIRGEKKQKELEKLKLWKSDTKDRNQGEFYAGNHAQKFEQFTKKGEVQMQERIQEAKKVAASFRWALVSLIPIILATKVALEVAYFGMVYLYNGAGWIESITTVLAERQFIVYIDNFYEKVLHQAYQVVALADATF